MIDNEERQRIVQAVFAATGRKLNEDDPLTLAALFYATTVRDAGKEAASEVTAAAAPLIESAQSAALDRRDATTQPPGFCLAFLTCTFNNKSKRAVSSDGLNIVRFGADFPKAFQPFGVATIHLTFAKIGIERRSPSHHRLQTREVCV